MPDGDTGTNMGLTMSSAVKELPEQTDIPKAAERLAMGLFWEPEAIPALF